MQGLSSKRVLTLAHSFFETLPFQISTRGVSLFICECMRSNAERIERDEYGNPDQCQADEFSPWPEGVFQEYYIYCIQVDQIESNDKNHDLENRNVAIAFLYSNHIEDVLD